MNLKAGDFVYAVREYDPPDAKQHTWMIVAVKVASASDKQIRLAKMKSAFGFKTRFDPDALGRIFHASKRGAIDHFQALATRRIESARREAKDAQRAIEWVADQLVSGKV